jgi:predicted TIM-barrel fold metal-dependent hydrolase
MKLGRFVVDTHVHAQRFAAGPQLSKMSPRADGTRYSDLAQAIRRIEAFDNSPRLLYDMGCYRVDKCVLLPAFGMSNEINIALVEKYPDKFVACCQAMKTAKRAILGEEPWSAQAAAKELDELLATGKFVGIGEGTPANSAGRKTLSMNERLDQMRPAFEMARKYKVVMRVHTGVVMGYPMTHHYWPESLHPLWVTDLAVEYPDVPILLDHGGMQGWWSERTVEEAWAVAASNDNVYIETGLYWTELYRKALRDPNIGPEKMVWGTDWGASVPFYTQWGQNPQVYPVQVRNEPPVRHQIDFWGWSLRQLSQLDISQDDLNLILGGNAARLFKLDVPHSRLFRPVSARLVPQWANPRSATNVPPSSRPTKTGPE